MVEHKLKQKYFSAWVKLQSILLSWLAIMIMVKYWFLKLA